MNKPLLLVLVSLATAAVAHDAPFGPADPVVHDPAQLDPRRPIAAEMQASVPDGFTAAAVDLHLAALSALIEVRSGDLTFDEKFRDAMQNDVETASRVGELKVLLDRKGIP